MRQGKFGAIPPGWIGGFAQSNPAFAYPKPDLSSLKLLGNHGQHRQAAAPAGGVVARVQLADVFQASRRPAVFRCSHRIFPVLATPMREGSTRSSVPQQGSCSKLFGCLNVEVTVTGQRGWADETAKLVAADLTVEGKIWFTPSTLSKSAREGRFGNYS